VKAWQFTRAHQPLTLVDVPEPKPEADEVLIDIRAAGLCHSDVGLLNDDDFPLAPGASAPLILGHEVAGVISGLGQGVTGWHIGDRVGIANINPLTVPGLARDGGYSFKLTAETEVLVPIPRTVTFEQAAVGTDAGTAAYHAVLTDGQVKAGQKVGVIGFGGVGQIGARIAQIQGAEVYVAEVKEAIWPLAKEIGAVRIDENITEFAGENLDVIIDFAGFGTTTAAAIETVRPGGRVVQVGMGRLAATISTRSLILKQVTLIGCLSDTKQDLAGVYELMATGELDPTLTTFTFAEIPDGLKLLAKGAILGRAVATITTEV
jgi:propanol-preferring alcohol dehydrogenase